MNLGISINRDADSVVRTRHVQYMVVTGLRAVVTGSVCINLLKAIVKTDAVRLYERSRHLECQWRKTKDMQNHSQSFVVTFCPCTQNTLPRACQSILFLVRAHCALRGSS